MNNKFYFGIGRQPYSRMGETAFHNFIQDGRLREVKFARKNSDDHEKVLYDVSGLRVGFESKTDNYRLIDSTTLENLSKRLKEDATKPLPNKVKIVRASADFSLVGIFFSLSK